MSKSFPKHIENKESIVRTNISFPKSLHKQIKQSALNEDITLNALILKAVRKYIKK